MSANLHTWVLRSGECCTFLLNHFWVSYVKFFRRNTIFCWFDGCLTYCFLILCTLIRILNDDFYKVWTYSNIFFRLRSAFCHGHVYICTVYCIVRYILNELLKSISRIFHLMHNLKNTPFLINSIWSWVLVICYRKKIDLEVDIS